MAIKEKAELKKLFQTLDKPTQQDFADWLDSFVHVNEYAVVQLIKATVAQAKAGTDNNTYITPLSLLETIRENAPEAATNDEVTAGTDQNKYVTPDTFDSAFNFYISINSATFGQALAGGDTLKFISPASLKHVLLEGPIKRTFTYNHADKVSYTGTVSPDLAAPDETKKLVKIASGVDVNNGIISFSVVAIQGDNKDTVKMTISKGTTGKPTIQRDFKDANINLINSFFVAAANSQLKLDIYVYIVAKGNNAGPTIEINTFLLLNGGVNLITPEVVYFKQEDQKRYIDSEYYDTLDIKPSVDGNSVIEFYQVDKYVWQRHVGV